ncbi:MULTISPECIES: ROK family transcriptional regulator [Microbacterium]|uniref:ROK family transcriptional regulator n=1 Tax=Microbacterium TaxID=33882 RepID=UPI0007004A9B|nr:MULTISPECIES: ROK family transcriptional regulator [Microbacterium]KQP68262.1 transcriptional regulator [Microbacterium sp. Leaf288]MDR7113695.1 putative NBD/HSP70 family sugar kinase [Microbacterium trichothecenolyticum]MDT0144750.1 ROK family transcriptional regulator [Microbacterium sp. PRC9]
MSDPTAAEGVRQRNLARLLRLVHLEGPLSRARLTEATGLNRSTIADLVAELVREGLVVERAPDPSRRVGRPSPVVAADARVMAIAANPEVDALTIAAVGLDRGIPVRERIELDRLLSPDETARLIAERVETWRAGELAHARIVGVGLAVPGLVRAADGLVRNAPHLRWVDAPVRDLVAEATGLPTVVGNDATLGAIAEHLYGAAAGFDDVVYLNGGASGIGGGLIVHGKPLLGAGGYTGEFGQNRPGIASATDRRAGDGVLEDEVSRARLLAAVGLHAADEPTLAAAVSAAGPTAAEEVARQRRILSTALANAVNALNPSVVVLGGFLATIAAVDVPGLGTMVQEQTMSATSEHLLIRVASLAEDRLLIGAAEAAFAELLRDPGGAARS